MLHVSAARPVSFEMHGARSCWDTSRAVRRRTSLCPGAALHFTLHAHKRPAHFCVARHFWHGLRAPQ
eukprot:3661125-Pleurochrysis_carterae.AAC.1